MIRLCCYSMLALFLAACAATTPRLWELAAGVKTISVNGYNMAHVERGSGQPVILVHGTVGDYRSFSLQMEPFAERHRTIALSLRHSYPERWDGKADSLTMRQHVADLAAFIRTLDAGKVHLVGFSRGGQVALQMASQHPELIQSLVLADPAPVASLLQAAPTALASLERRRTFVLAAMEQLQGGNTDAGLERFVDGVSGPGSWNNLPEANKQNIRDNAWTIKSLLADANEALGCEQLKRIEVPVLLVSGERSPDEYRHMQDAIQPCLTRNERAIVPQAGHVMNRANPKVFNTLLLGVLAKR
jgi:esterase